MKTFGVVIVFILCFLYAFGTDIKEEVCLNEDCKNLSIIPSYKSTVLITGGGTGIGFGLAKRFVALGHQVIITGRRKEKLDEAKALLPDLITIQGDISTEDGRESIFNEVIKDYPNINILINNAGIYLETSMYVTDRSQWLESKKIISTNLEGTIHLTYLFLPTLKLQPQSLIITVTSGAAFVHATDLTYSLTKAALHYWLNGLRIRLRNSSIKVVEAIAGPTLTDMLIEEMKSIGVTVDEYCDDIILQLQKGQTEFGYGLSAPLPYLNRTELDALDEQYAHFLK